MSENEIKVEPKDQKEYHVVGYSDGAARPSRGFWGSGYFGYIYDNSTIGSSTKGLPKDINPTTLGFMSVDLIQEDPEFYKANKPVKPSYYFVGSISGDDINTNNFGEAYGLKKFLLFVQSLDLNIKHVSIFLDSQMLIYVLKELFETPNPDTSKYAFPELYKEIEDIIKSLREKGIKVAYRHTYAHSSSFGNNIADRLAFLGRIKSQTRLEENPEDKNRLETEILFKTNPDKNEFWITTSLSPYLYGDTLFFTAGHTRGESPYIILDYDKDQEVGEKSGEVLMGSIYHADGEDKIESIIDRHLNFKPDLGNVFSLDLKNVKHYMTNFFYSIDPVYCFTKDNRVGNLTVVEDFPLARTLRPGGLAVQLLDKFVLHYDVLTYLDRKMSGEEVKSFEFLDVTEKFFIHNENAKKNKYECKINIKDVGQVIPFRDTDIVLCHKVDIPDRNYFKRLENSKGIMINLAIREVAKDVFEYFTIVSILTPEDKQIHSVWNNFYSNKLYLNKKA